MFLDGQSFENGHVVEADVCIIGAGVAGMTLARELRDTATNVCVVESGGQKHDWRTNDLGFGENVGYPYWSLADVRQRQLGGTANLWFIGLGSDGQQGLKLRPLDSIDFEKRPWVPHSGWPITREDLDPFYDRAQRCFGLGPALYDGAAWADAATAPLLPVDPERVRTVVFQHAERTVFTDEHRDDLERSQNITTLLNSTVVEVETDENAKLGRSARVRTFGGNEFHVHARVFVLAAGGLETPRLMLLSNSVQPAGLGNDNDVVGRYFMEHPHFVSGTFIPSDASVFDRTRLYDKHMVDAPGDEGDTSRRDIIMGSLSLSEQTTRSESLLNFCATLAPTSRSHHDIHLSKGFASLRELRSYVKDGHRPANAGRHVLNIVRDAPVLGAHAASKIVDVIRSKAGRRKGPVAFDLYHMSEQAPNPDSRVTLSDTRDPFGQRRMRLDWRLTERDIASVLNGQRLMDLEFRRAGLGHIRPDHYDEMPPAGIRGGYHHMGTTRMSSDPNTGVVDASSRVHGLANVFVAGSSVFPTAGFANPTLTVVALTIRLADHIRSVLRASQL